MTCKLIYLARQAETVSREDWPRTWKSHAVFASQFPALEANIEWLRYCNRIDEPILDGEPMDIPELSTEHDGVAIAAAQSLEELTGTAFSEKDRALIDEDELRVFDMLTPNFTYFCREVPIREGRPGEAAIFLFLPREPATPQEAFRQRWNGSHAEHAKEALASMAGVTRYIHNVPVHDPLPLFPFDGIVEIWFETPEHALRALRGSDMARIRSDLAEFCNMTDSVTMLTTPCHRWPKD